MLVLILMPLCSRHPFLSHSVVLLHHRPGLINVDFADVRTIMGDAGTALMGIGRGSGQFLTFASTPYSASICVTVSMRD